VVKGTENGMSCTVVTTATGGRCGATGVHSFRGTCGSIFRECAAHSTARVKARAVGTREVGDRVAVRRHGRVYAGTVTRVGARGATYATFTYDNGVTREVRV
jgi:hypothetical protein